LGVILEINAGPMAGKVIGLKTGDAITVGRAAGRAQFALPHDTFMSGVHFAVECGPQGCRVLDRKSSNGTFLNGARIQDAMLANGDEIKGGQTTFKVKIVSDAKLASFLPPQEAAPPAASTPPAASPSVLPQRPSVAEPLPQPVHPASQQVEEPRPAPMRAATEPPHPPGSPFAEPVPPSPLMQTADLDEAASSRHTRDAAELPGRETPGKGALPRVEEPPRFHAIPSPPLAGAQPPRASEDPAGQRARPKQGSEPPPGVAPYIAEKFAERPAARGAGSARSAAFSVMGWSFPAAPAEWLVQEGFGLQQSGCEDFPSSVAATEEPLGGITLQQFVESQICTLRAYLRDPKIEPTMPPRVGGADESMAVDVRHSTKDGRELIYRRIYARSGSSVGVLTVTTLAADFPQVLQSLQYLLDGAAFHSTVN
jgi:pSer/pThr/pTyr-binding forkhead associated (FHA) protein